ncbi:putative uncharacterized protein DDB_G0294196 isoform X2 [Hermetia illucens]|uniref:putative uncharacterized protein DDB_G0294196 isoform X2 n=1 Tax=Hermetia illucens TaxID=343691 RepID=UPI0018CC67D0|nr:putative uncharacterized protein DDB_G0294196 isoform X2 [Hermetia illucens]
MPRHRKQAKLFLDIMQSTDSDESHSGMDEKRPCMPRGGINMPEEVQAECHNSDTLDGIPELPADEDDEDASSSANIINVEPHSQSTSTTGFIQSSSYPPQPTPGPSGYQAFAQSSQRPDVRQNFMYNQQFNPQWQNRFTSYRGPTHLPPRPRPTIPLPLPLQMPLPDRPRLQQPMNPRSAHWRYQNRGQQPVLAQSIQNYGFFPYNHPASNLNPLPPQRQPQMQYRPTPPRQYPPQGIYPQQWNRQPNPNQPIYQNLVRNRLPMDPNAAMAQDPQETANWDNFHMFCQKRRRLD